MADAGWFTRDEIRRARDWTDDLTVPADGTHRLRAIPPHFSISRLPHRSVARRNGHLTRRE